MIKVSVFYENKPGAKFDMDYYVAKHMPMVASKLGSACKGVSVDGGVAGGAAGQPAAFVAIGHLLFDSADAFQAAFGPHAGEIMSDVPNYTDLQPIIQVSEVKL